VRKEKRGERGEKKGERRKRKRKREEEEERGGRLDIAPGTRPTGHSMNCN